MASPILSVNFHHYEHEGIEIVIQPMVGGGSELQITRYDTKVVLTKISLPRKTMIIDKRRSPTAIPTISI